MMTDYFNDELINQIKDKSLNPEKKMKRIRNKNFTPRIESKSMLQRRSFIKKKNFDGLVPLIYEQNKNK